MHCITKWIAGLLLMLIQIKENCTAKKECLIRRTEEEKLLANCSTWALNPPYGVHQYNSDDPYNPQLIEIIVPKKFMAHIEIIDLSGFTAKSLPLLYDYPRITEVYLRDIEGSPPDSFFNSVPKLQKLDTSYSRFNWPPRFPSSLTTLRADSLLYQKPSLSNLDQLENLYFSNNDLERFPIIPEQAPIVRLDLSENYYMKVTLMEIAPFCRLKYINLHHTHMEHASCCEMETWLFNRGITYRLSCRDGGRDDYNRELEFSEALETERCVNATTFAQADAKYNECLRRTESQSSFFSSLLIVIFVAFLIMLTSGMIYSSYKWNAPDSKSKPKPKDEPSQPSPTKRKDNI